MNHAIVCLVAFVCASVMIECGLRWKRLRRRVKVNPTVFAILVVVIVYGVSAIVTWRNSTAVVWLTAHAVAFCTGYVIAPEDRHVVSISDVRLRLASAAVVVLLVTAGLDKRRHE